MAYFNHAFCKAFNPSAIGNPGQPTSALAAGEISLVDGDTWQTITPGGVANAGLLYLVQGSYHNVAGGDTIGNNPGHGGYAESVKSKGINPKYINKLWRQDCVTPTQGESCISVGAECVPCGTSLYLRVDVKGSPALRFLNHNAYAIGDSGGVCCDPGDGSEGSAQEYIDPALALASAAQMVLADPIVKPFIAEKNAASTGGVTVTITDNTASPATSVSTTYTIAQILDGTYVPSLEPNATSATVSVELCLVGAYVGTSFGDCSFDTRDFYGKEPVSIIASFIDESGDPCSDCGTTTSTPGTMGSTYGDTVLREIIATESYMQSPFNQGRRDSARIREIEGSDRILSSVDRAAFYKAYYILHSVPRFNNPTGVFDNDQYLYKIYVACDDDATAEVMDEIMDSLSQASGVSYGSLDAGGGSGSVAPPNLQQLS